MLDEQEYKTSTKLYYTHSQDDQIKQEIKDNGTVEMINQDDIVITALPLEKIKKKFNIINTPKEITREEKKNVETNKLFKNNFTTITKIGLLIIELKVII